MIRGATGYMTWSNPGGADLIERDTFTCCHCNSVVIVEPKQAAADAGGWCLCCNKPICPRCADIPTCAPFLRQIEQAERKDRMRRSIENAIYG